MKNIFVGNLCFGTTEDEIRAMFEVHGTVDRVNLVTDREPDGPGALDLSRWAAMEKERARLRLSMGANSVAACSI